MEAESGPTLGRGPRRGRVLAVVGGAGAAVLLVVLGRFRPEASGLARLGLVPVLLLLAFAVLNLLRRREPVAAGRVDRSACKPARAWGIAAGLWALGVPVWAGLFLFGGPPDQEWTRWPYVDKRWLVVLYWSSWLAVVVAPPLVAALLERLAARGRPTPPAAGGISGPASRGGNQRRWAAALVAGLVATALFGPPWHTTDSIRGIDCHESVNWSGLQGMHAGYPPYIGPASNNYGPGMQLAIYAYMKATDQFTVPGYRETHGVADWAALVLIGAFAAYHLGLGVGIAAVLLALVISPLAFWTWTPDGVLDGFFGWANPLRQVGPTLLALGFGGLIAEPRSRRRDALRAAAIGVLWGLASYYSQENLMAGGAVLGVMLVLCACDAPCRRKLVPIAAGVAAGIGSVAVLVAAWYVPHGLLRECWANYSLVPSRFLRGYANTPWTGDLATDPFAIAYYALPFLVALLAALPLYRQRPLRFAPVLDRDRLYMVGMAVAFLCSNGASLLRSDSFHLVVTLFPLTVLLPWAVTRLPALVSDDPLRRGWARAAIVALATVVFLPVWIDAPGRLRGFVAGRAQSLARLGSPAARFVPSDEIERRFGPSLSRLYLYGRTADLLRQVKAAVGDVPVFVFTDSPALELEDSAMLYAGYVYFLADLFPGPLQLERTDMVADTGQLRTFLHHFEAHAGAFGAVVSSVQSSEEIRLFLRAHPRATTRRIEGLGGALWVVRD